MDGGERSWGPEAAGLGGGGTEPARPRQRYSGDLKVASSSSAEDGVPENPPPSQILPTLE